MIFKARVVDFGETSESKAFILMRGNSPPPVISMRGRWRGASGFHHGSRGVKRLPTKAGSQKQTQNEVITPMSNHPELYKMVLEKDNWKKNWAWDNAFTRPHRHLHQRTIMTSTEAPAGHHSLGLQWQQVGGCQGSIQPKQEGRVHERALGRTNDASVSSLTVPNYISSHSHVGKHQTLRVLTPKSSNTPSVALCFRTWCSR